MPNKKDIKKRVLHLLETTPHLRDNDERLIATIWWQDLQRLGYDPKTTSAHQLLALLIARKLSQAESIRRDRASFQSSNVRLRGPWYEERKKNSVQWRTHLGYGGNPNSTPPNPPPQDNELPFKDY